MSFVILRHAKIKNSAKGAAVSHNHRLGDEVEKINIDPKKQHLNRSLMGQGAMQRLNAKLPEKMRKDAVVAIETLITASPEFFDEIEKDREKLSQNPKFKKWVIDSQIWMKKEWGDNVVDAVLHMDESTPHIHFLTVPLVKDGRLCAKDFLALGVMQRHQTEYAQAMESHGLQRGLPAKETKRRHIGLKEAPGSGGQASQLAAQLVAKQAELDKVQVRFDRLNKLSMGDMAVIAELKKKVEKMEKQITQLTDENTKLAADKAKFAEMATAYQAEKDKGTPAHLIAPGTALPPEVLGPNARAKLRAEQMAIGVTKTTQEPPKVNTHPIAPPINPQTLEMAFLALHPALKAVEVTQIDGLRLDASCGRLGVFSRSDSKLGRVSVLCKVPSGKVMPAVGQCFDKREETQQQKGGIAR